MVRVGALIVASAVVASSALRRASKQDKNDNATIQSAPMVDGLYTFGSPAISNPPLQNRRSSNGCFPGARMWAAERKGWFGHTVDIVVPLATVAPMYYLHPYMEGWALNNDVKTRDISRCSERLTGLPTSYSVSALLHMKWLYRDLARDLLPTVAPTDFVMMGWLGNIWSYWRGSSGIVAVADALRENGWGLVGSGMDEGIWGIQGSHFAQNPETLECVLTFQGSETIGDWMGNTQIQPAPYCSLNTEVHQGFRDHLRRMLMSPTWQQRVRPHLGKCSKLYVTGHSLGGALGALFTACAAAAPRNDPDYGMLSWEKGTPQRLPYL